MRIKETKVYKFNELSNTAKERARDWYRSRQDNDFAESIIEDAAACADIIGINLRTRPVKLMDGTTRYEPCVFWSGFSSQGDGACFEGRYAYSKGSPKHIREHAPKDTELHRIASDLARLQRAYRFKAEFETKQRGHYQHSGCMEVRDVGDVEVSESDFDSFKHLLRDFADWIYRQLEREYDWTMADAQVDESILANEYEFTEEGRIV